MGEKELWKESVGGGENLGAIRCSIQRLRVGCVQLHAWGAMRAAVAVE